ncbi:MAG TPA: DUF1631 family protein [Rhodanobacteraceae bacterium]|nr:DUF1631 family protein [Rhodanobacteraceae bacterium]
MSAMPASIDARADLPARVRDLLTQQLTIFGRQLEPLLHGSLLALRHQLGKGGESRPRSGAEDQAMLTAMQSAKQLDAEIIDVLRRAFEPKLAAFDQATATSRHKPSLEGNLSLSLEGGLSLVDDREFEESVLLDDIATRADTRAARQLFELGYRYGALAARAPFEAEELVVGPHALLRGFGEIARAAGLPREHRIAWYHLLDAPLIGAVDGAYAALNQQLIDQGIFSSLRPYLPRRGSEPRTRRGPESALPGQPPDTAGDEVLKPLRKLLARRRELLKLEDAPADAQPASLESAQAALAALQQRVLTGAQPDARGVQGAMRRLHQDLLAELHARAPEAKAARLADEQRDVLDLVSLWFERLLDETRPGGAAQRLLYRLQIPCLRMALADPSVFQRGTHPARRLLNSVLETAALWIDGGEGELDGALLEKLRQVVDYTLANFNGDPALFEAKAIELEDHLNDLRHRAELAECRHLDAAQGREKLELARTQAAAAIGALTSGRKLGALTRALLEQAWTDALALAALRHGEDSEEFTRALDVAAELLREPGERDDSLLLGELEQGLLEVGLNSGEANQLAHRVLDREAPGGDEQATQTELLVRLKSRQRLGGRDEDTSDAAPPLTEEEQRHLKRLRALPFNTWFECTIGEQGRRVQRKLIWYADDGRCLLVNVRGATAGSRMLEQLARQMAAGHARLLPRQEESLIDRGWHLVVASLRQFGKAEVERA